MPICEFDVKVKKKESREQRIGKKIPYLINVLTLS